MGTRGYLGGTIHTVTGKLMMKKVLIVLSLIVYSTGVFGQQANIWRFGYNAGLDFSSGSGVFFINPTNPAVFTAIGNQENATSISDENGNLLFYTQGNPTNSANIVLYNGVHTVVGNLNSTNSSSAQGALAVPRPGSTTDYFLVTADAVAGNGGTYRGVQYFNITASSPSSVSFTGPNVLLASTSTPGAGQTLEALAAAPHSNGTDYWVLAHNGGNGFRSWQVTSAGFSAPVTSNVGPNAGGEQIALIKFNSCYTKVAMSILNGNVTIFDFNFATGALSNPVTVSTAAQIPGAYGLEFSNSGDYLYISQTEVANRGVFQYNVTTAAAPVKLGPVFSSGINYGGHLQLGPDGVIYSSNLNSYGSDPSGYVGRILNADSPTPTFQPTWTAVPFSFNGGGSVIGAVGMGLPTLLRSLVSNIGTVDIDGVSVNATNQVCQNRVVNMGLTVSGLTGGTATWRVYDASNTLYSGYPVSTAINASGFTSRTHTFSSLGVNRIEITLTDNCGRPKVIEANVEVIPFITPDFNFSCSGSNVTLTGTVGTGGTPANYVYYNNTTGAVIGTGASVVFPFTTNVDVRVEDMTPYTGGGPFSASYTGTLGYSSNAGRLISNFDALAAFTLSSVTFAPRDGATAGLTSTIQLFQGATAVPGFTTTYTWPATGVDVLRTVNLFWSIPAGTGYSLRVTAGTMQQFSVRADRKSVV